eukprot:Protomagalhaensia_sp_Gyna_25__888@NODE_142_length_4920_cov_484_660930_g112_i0_p1_GENE_NODE_142_length_4920_cov_484_660930_g112_i0NODE_142_length_4920_cov_484_660930_g112_i0_p1_ORF_typecomplete_len441_score47_48_NODE_142_length_4920_cov_484_660930_g112_i013012623
MAGKRLLTQAWVLFSNLQLTFHLETRHPSVGFYTLSEVTKFRLMFTVRVCALVWIVVTGIPVTPLAPPVVTTYPLRPRPWTEAGITETFVRAPPRLLLSDWKRVFAELVDAREEFIEQKEEQTEENRDAAEHESNGSRTIEANPKQPPRKEDQESGSDEENEDPPGRAHIHPETPLSTDSDAGLEGRSVFIPSPEFEKKMISNLRRQYSIPDRSPQDRPPYSSDIPGYMVDPMQLNALATPDLIRGPSKTRPTESWNQQEDETALNAKLDEAFGLGNGAPFRSTYQRRPGSRFGERPRVPGRIEEHAWNWQNPKEPAMESQSGTKYGDVPYKGPLYGNGRESNIDSSHYESPIRRDGSTYSETSYGLNRPLSLRDSYHPNSYNGRISRDAYSPMVADTAVAPHEMDPYVVGNGDLYNGPYAAANPYSSGSSRRAWMRDYY